jgi:hypothetical protein
MSPVSAVPAADSGAALAHFSTSLSFETDCADEPRRISQEIWRAGRGLTVLCRGARGSASD